MDLTALHYVKRIVVGNDDPSRIVPAGDIEKSMALLNRCLHDIPKGQIVAVDKGFSILEAEGAQVIMQWCAYHVGFPRKPHWLEEEDHVQDTP